MQNIPSHAEDIRHMFRATPKHAEVLDCSYDRSTELICVDVPRINYVSTSNRGDIQISDLVVGDVVKLLEDGKEVYRIVKEISVADNDTILCHVVF